MTFRIYWQTGILTTIEGKDIISAFNNTYSENSLEAIDFYKDESVKTCHKWDSKSVSWIESDNEIIDNKTDCNFELMYKMCKVYNYEE